MKKVRSSSLCGCLAVLLGIIAMFVPFATGITATATVSKFSTSNLYQAYGIIFGSNLPLVATANEASTAGLIAGWATLLAGIVIVLVGLVLPLFVKSKKNKVSIPDLLFFVGGLAMIGGAVVFFFAKPLLTLSNDDVTTYKLGAGFIIPAIAGILGGISAVLAPCLKEK